MKPILKYTLIGLLVVAVAGITIVGVAYAEGDFPKGREALAELLGLTVDELKEQIQGGKTVEDLADEAGVDLDAFHEAMQEERLEDLGSRIEEALAAGDITQAHADWLLEGLEKGFLGESRWMKGQGKMGHFEGPTGENSFGDWPHKEGRPNRGSFGELPHCDQ
jgi:hypothetical protein